MEDINKYIQDLSISQLKEAVQLLHVESGSKEYTMQMTSLLGCYLLKLKTEYKYPVVFPWEMLPLPKSEIKKWGFDYAAITVHTSGELKQFQLDAALCFTQFQNMTQEQWNAIRNDSIPGLVAYNAEIRDKGYSNVEIAPEYKSIVNKVHDDYADEVKELHAFLKSSKKSPLGCMFSMALLLVVFSLTCFISCHSSNNSTPPVDYRKGDSLKRDSVIRFNEARLDSIIGSFSEKEFLFMNYPSFVRKSQFNEITELNIRRKKLNQDMTYTAYIDEGKSMPFQINGSFRDGKLTSVDLFQLDGPFEKSKGTSVDAIDFIEDNSVKDRIENLNRVKKYYMAKYGQPQVKRFEIKRSPDAKGFWGITDSIEYKFKVQEKLILISISTSFQQYVSSGISGKDILVKNIPYRISYYTEDTFKFVQSLDAKEKKKDDSKIKATKEVL